MEKITMLACNKVHLGEAPLKEAGKPEQQDCDHFTREACDRDIEERAAKTIPDAK